MKRVPITPQLVEKSAPNSLCEAGPSLGAQIWPRVRVPMGRILALHEVGSGSRSFSTSWTVLETQDLRTHVAPIPPGFVGSCYCPCAVPATRGRPRAGRRGRSPARLETQIRGSIRSGPRPPASRRRRRRRSRPGHLRKRRSGPAQRPAESRPGDRPQEIDLGSGFATGDVFPRHFDLEAPGECDLGQHRIDIRTPP